MNFSAHLVAALTIATSSVAQGQQATVTEDASREFRQCYAKVKVPWLVDVLAPPDANAEELRRRVLELAPGEDPGPAVALVQERRGGKHPTSQVMAADSFLSCMDQSAAESFTRNRTVACFREQRLVLLAMDLRFSQQLPELEAIELYLSGNQAQAEAAKASAKRVISATYRLLEKGREGAFAEAQFQLCMRAK